MNEVAQPLQSEELFEKNEVAYTNLDETLQTN